MGNCLASGAVGADMPPMVIKEEDLRQIKMSELMLHNRADSMWLAIDGKVYDVTKWQHSHPGGAHSIMMSAGSDATEGFERKHGENARKILESLCIGFLDGGKDRSMHSASSRRSRRSSTVINFAIDGTVAALQQGERLAATLSSREQLTHDTLKLDFTFPDDTQSLGVPIGHHIILNAPVDGEMDICRSYTPVTLDDLKGKFTLVIKVYHTGTDDQFPSGGAMSQYLESMKIGDTIDVTGPRGHWTYLQRGNFRKNKREGHFKQLGLVCGGTGITPCYQLIQAILGDAEDTTKISLIFSNRTEEDIILRKELDDLAAKHPERLQVCYTLTKPSEGWRGETGRVSSEMISKYLPGPDDDMYIGLCGPGGFVHNHCVPLLMELGHQSDHTWSW